MVIFIGAGEGFPMEGPNGTTIECCGPDWAAEYANRVRQMMNTYRQGGDARVYWLSVPTSRNPKRWDISQVVNEAVEVAAIPWLSQIRIIDLVPIFTPGGIYSDTIDIDGEETIVRESDGLHLNETGASVAADAVIEKLGQDFNLAEP